MGEMASTLAHEINQPLSAISNYLQGCNRLLETVEHPNVPKIRDALAETTKQTLRAGHIIRQLREFVARGETEKRPENISKLVEEASALALVGAKEEGVKTLFRFASHTDTVLVEKVQIQQVLLNLMRNAIEAMQGCERKELAGDDLGAERRHDRRSASRIPVSGLSEEIADAAVSAFRDDQARRHGRRAVDLQAHHRGAWRGDVGRAQSRRRHHLPLHLASRRPRTGGVG